MVRCNNVYGPGQFPEKVIPRFATRLLACQKLQIQGDGSAVRMFIHAEDVARGVETILLKGALDHVYNINAVTELSVMQLAVLVLGILKPGADLEAWIERVPDRPFNDCRYSVDAAKLRALGWRERVDFMTGLRATLEWIKTNPS
jgi:dTDP-glucose 4,6-dehydratase